MAMADGIIDYRYGDMHDAGDQMTSTSGSLTGMIAELDQVMKRLFSVYQSEIASGQLTQLHAQWNQVSGLAAQVIGSRGTETHNAASNMRGTENSCAALFDQININV